MAKTPFNATVNKAGTTYTIPGGKYAVFAARLVDAGTTGEGGMSINGTHVATFYSPITITGNTGPAMEMKPFTAAAGDVIAGAGGGSTCTVGISGFLYDV